ncbi:MAG: hypothetical protein ACU83U_09225 [Gammaproteobacteria bacterium]
MGIFLNSGLSALFIIIMQTQAAQADPAQNQDDLFFSPNETALWEELDNARGREGLDMTNINNMNVRATLTGNQASNNVNGYNIIDHGSFAQASGINTVIQNTGNNVIIQDATNVIVTITP